MFTTRKRVFIYLQSRYYDPETGRFISADAYLVAGDHINSTNMFAYCLNNPVMYVDPKGTDTSTLKIIFSVVFCAALIAEVLPVDQGVQFAESMVNAEVPIELMLEICLDLVKSSKGELVQTTQLYGEPNTTIRVSKNTWRTFGPDGRALKDTDYDDRHPDIGNPHDHDWNWDGDVPSRSGPGPHTENIIIGVGIVALSGMAIAFAAANDSLGLGVADDVLIPSYIISMRTGLEIIGANL